MKALLATSKSVAFRVALAVACAIAAIVATGTTPAQAVTTPAEGTTGPITYATTVSAQNSFPHLPSMIIGATTVIHRPALQRRRP